ncbi:alanine racemase [Flavobacteriaceae bacterium]|nr:alanine racemase [Flavobacteriaceae bacterium]
MTFDETHLEINLEALAHNYHVLRQKLDPKTLLLAVVKAYSYGHETAVVARKLVALGVNYFAVAYAPEGSLLRNHEIDTPVLLLHPLPAHFETIVAQRLEPSLYSLDLVRHFITYLEARRMEQFPVHIKFNSGLNRLGLSQSDAVILQELLAKTKAIRIVSVFSHLAASEDPNERDFTLDQIARFDAFYDTLNQKLDNTPLRHILNTSGIFNFPEAQYDMVRSGIGLYGYGNDPKFDQELVPIARLKTVITQIHHLKAGQTVGYNRGHIADQTMTTATLAIGHADGISRLYGHGKGAVLIHGKKALIVGHVCMDMIMVDVTHIDCKSGEEAIVLGPELPASATAEAAGTISYELLTSLSQRIKRIVVNS